MVTFYNVAYISVATSFSVLVRMDHQGWQDLGLVEMVLYFENASKRPIAFSDQQGFLRNYETKCPVELVKLDIPTR